MGLVQRVLESAGIPSVSLSMIPEFTRAVGVPRLAGIAYPMSRPLGLPGDAAGQRDVLRAVLGVLDSAEGPGTYVELPFTWPETPARARKGADVHPPISQLLARRPWLLARLYRGEVPGEAERAAGLPPSAGRRERALEAGRSDAEAGGDEVREGAKPRELPRVTEDEPRISRGDPLRSEDT